MKKIITIIAVFTILCSIWVYKAAERDAKLINDYKSGKLEQATR